MSPQPTAAPAAVAEVPAAAEVPAGAPDAAGLPLAGVSVVSIALNLPGPLAAARLAELGARVTTVLPPAGDPVATLVPALFEELHRGQDVVTADLKEEAGRARLEELLAASDVFLTSSRAGALRRLGLDAAAVAARHPRVCQVDVTGYPGERADLPGHDLNYQAEAGLVAPEAMPRALVADVHGAERAVSAALASLHARGRDGRGRAVVVALSDAAHAMALSLRHGMTAPDALLGGASPFYTVYPARTGHVAVGAVEPHFARALLAELGIAPQEDVGARLRAAFAAETAEHWQAWGEQRGIPLTALAAAS